jgi:hypothetical protein
MNYIYSWIYTAVRKRHFFKQKRLTAHKQFPVTQYAIFTVYTEWVWVHRMAAMKHSGQLLAARRQKSYLNRLSPHIYWLQQWTQTHTRIITNSMFCLFLVYWIKIPVHVSGINVRCMYMAHGTSKMTFSEPGWNGTQLSSIPHYLLMGCWCPKHVEVF